MWTSTRVNSNVNRFTPNHFVPIVNKFKMPVSTPIVVEDIPGQYDDLSNELGSKEIHSQPAPARITFCKKMATYVKSIFTKNSFVLCPDVKLMARCNQFTPL